MSDKVSKPVQAMWEAFLKQAVPEITWKPTDEELMQYCFFSGALTTCLLGEEIAASGESKNVKAKCGRDIYNELLDYQQQIAELKTKADQESGAPQKPCGTVVAREEVNFKRTVIP